MTACPPGLRTLRDWHRDVPRLTDRLAKAVIFLFPSAEDAEKGTRGGASGFIVGQPTLVNPGAVFLWAVTNMHVARGGAPVLRTAGSGPNRVVVRTPDDWIVPADGDDLAVTPLGVVAGYDRDYRLSFIPREWFVDESDLRHTRQVRVAGTTNEPQGFPYGPGDQTAIVGRFLGYPGGTTNQPVSRFGNLAVSETVFVQPERRDFLQESLLVEARSLNGYSGSPVFIYRGYSLVGTVIQIDEPGLLGVDWGHLTARESDLTSYVVTWAETDLDNAQRYVSGMTVVVPAWKLAALLDSDEAVEVQQDWEQRLAAEDRDAAVMDAGAVDP